MIEHTIYIYIYIFFFMKSLEKQIKKQVVVLKYLNLLNLTNTWVNSNWDHISRKPVAWFDKLKEIKKYYQIN